MPLSLAHILPFYTPPSGTSQTPTTVPNLLVPLHCTIPVRPSSPPQLFLCMQRPTRVRLVCLGDCIVIIFEAEKVPSGPWNHRFPSGAFTLLGPDSIPDFSLISGSSGDKASPGPAAPLRR